MHDAEWRETGFDEVYEIVPKRIYQIYFQHRVFRIYVTRTLKSGHTIAWQPHYDELFDIGNDQVWSQQVAVPSSFLGTDEETCLRDGVRWLRDFLGIRP